jgi:hypothetical protein
VATDRSHKVLASRRYALTAALFLIGVVALYNWVISPHVGYLHAVQRLEPVVTRMAEELDAVGSARDEKLATMRGLRAELARVREGLFMPQEAKAFIQDLPTIVADAGCLIGAADFSVDVRETDDPNTSAAIEALHADCTIVGHYDEIAALLQSLRQSRRKVWVDSCQIDLVDPHSERLDCQLGLTLYIAKEKESCWDCSRQRRKPPR